ncbi:hypothetical protein AAG906_032972 [Vitis piasezkii]
MGFVLLAADEAPMLAAARNGIVIKTLPFRSMKCETAPPKPMTTPMPGLMALLFTAGWSHGFCYDGNSPLHMLAAKPTAFRSGMFLSFFDIIYHCSTFPINLNDHQFTYITHNLSCHHSSNATQGHQGFPSRYGRCQRFIKPIVSKALLVIFSIVGKTITP